MKYINKALRTNHEYAGEELHRFAKERLEPANYDLTQELYKVLKDCEDTPELDDFDDIEDGLQSATQSIIHKQVAILLKVYRESLESGELSWDDIQDPSAIDDAATDILDNILGVYEQKP